MDAAFVSLCILFALAITATAILGMTEAAAGRPRPLLFTAALLVASFAFIAGAAP
jgi:hypothetical protein